MAAVLSLGAVGYGVALIYVLFGAPDLAMTQFAVETLTVVIFVLVFHQLRGFGDLSSRLVKAARRAHRRARPGRSSPRWCSSSALPARRRALRRIFVGRGPARATAATS